MVTALSNSLKLKDKKTDTRISNPFHGRRLLDIKNASTYLGIGIFGVRTLIWRGELPIVRWGRKILIDVNDLDKFIEKSKSSYFLRVEDERGGGKYGG